MKRIKHFALTLLSVACTAVAAFGMTSCEKVQGLIDKVKGIGHDHEYTEVVTAPTCTEKGYTTYTCECGESYVDNYVDAAHTLESHAAKAATCTEAGYGAYEKCTKCDYTTFVEAPATGHKYEALITKYPSVSEAGEKSFTCPSCGDKKTEEIAALTVSLPKVSEVIAGMIGGVSCQLSLEEGSSITIVDEYSAEVNGQKVYVSVDVAEALIDTIDGELAGHIKLEFNTYSVALDGTNEADTATGTVNTGALYLYVNGEAISLEVTDFDGSKMTQESNMSELVYTAIAQSMGMTYNDFMDIAYIYTEVAEYAPKIAAMVGSAVGSSISVEYIESLETLCNLFAENVIVETKDENGNSVYTLNMQALDLFLDEIDGKTVGQYVDEVFGAGAMNAATNFVASLPEMKVREIATSAITLAENYDVDINEVYDLINFIAYKAYGAQIEVKSLIESCYDLTLGEIILSEMGGAQITVAEMKMVLAQAMSSLGEMTFDELYNLLADNGKTDVETSDGAVMTSEEESEPFSITAELRGLVDMLGEAVTVEVVINETAEVAELVSFEVNVSGVGISYVHGADGSYAVNAVCGNIEALAILTKDSLVLQVSDETGLRAAASLMKEEGAHITYKADLIVDAKDYLDFEAVVALDDTLLRLDATVRANKTERMGIVDQETGETEWVENVTFIDLLDINYVYNYDGVEERARLTIAIPDANETLTLNYVSNAEETVYTADLVYSNGEKTDDYLDFEAKIVNGTLTQASLVIRGYETKYDSAYDPVTGEKYETQETVFEEKVNVAYYYVSEPSKDTFVLTVIDVTFTLVHEVDGANTSYVLTATVDEEVMMEASFYYTETVENNVTTENYIFKVWADGYECVQTEVTVVNGEVTAADALFTVITTEYIVNVDSVTGEELDRVEKTTKIEYALTYDGEKFDFVLEENDVKVGDGSVVITENSWTYSMEMDGVEFTEIVTLLENGISYDVYLAQGEEVMFDAEFALTGEGTDTTGNLTLAYDIEKMWISGDGDYLAGAGVIAWDWVLPALGNAVPDDVPENTSPNA